MSQATNCDSPVLCYFSMNKQLQLVLAVGAPSPSTSMSAPPCNRNKPVSPRIAMQSLCSQKQPQTLGSRPAQASTSWQDLQILHNWGCNNWDLELQCWDVKLRCWSQTLRLLVCCVCVWLRHPALTVVFQDSEMICCAYAADRSGHFQPAESNVFLLCVGLNQSAAYASFCPHLFCVEDSVK